jgi:hypothetical protein
MNDILHTTEYDIKNFLIKNIHLNYDIYIIKPEFLTKNISNAQFFLTDEFGNKSELLDNYIYKIVFKSSEIYTDTLKSNQDLFFYSDIPFEYIYYHIGCFILENIPTDIVKKILNYKINFIYTESQTLQHYLPIQSANPFSMKWNCGIGEDKPEENMLRIMCGMVGCTYNSKYIDENFYNRIHKFIYYSDNMEQNMLSLNYLDNNNDWISGFEDEIEIYTIGKYLYILATKQNQLIQDFNNHIQNQNQNQNQNQIQIQNQLNESVNLLSCRLKIPINGICQNNDSNDDSGLIKFISTNILYSQADGLTNIMFLCDNNKYTINKVYLDRKLIKNKKTDMDEIIYEEIYEPYDMEFDKFEYGYKILGFGDFFLIPIISNHEVKIRIEFCVEKNHINFDSDNILFYDKSNHTNILSNLFDDFWIKYDGVLMGPKFRRALAQSEQDYDEYPIVNIMDYYEHNNPHNNNNRIYQMQNQNLLPIQNQNLLPIQNQNLLPIQNQNLPPIQNQNLFPMQNQNLFPMQNQNLPPIQYFPRIQNQNLPPQQNQNDFEYEFNNIDKIDDDENKIDDDENKIDDDENKIPNDYKFMTKIILFIEFILFAFSICFFLICLLGNKIIH